MLNTQGYPFEGRGVSPVSHPEREEKMCDMTFYTSCVTRTRLDPTSDPYYKLVNL